MRNRLSRIKRLSKPEHLESRRVNATLSGAVWIDHNGSSSIDAADSPVASAIVWIDGNRNGLQDAGEPVTRTTAGGTYTFENLPAGDHEVRMQPPPGLFQTSPSEYFAFYHGSESDQFGLAQIDVRTGAVSQTTPAIKLGLRHGVIKTIQGDYFGAGHSTDSLFRIDPVTGTQIKIGHTGKELVAGLAYDPIMDKIYTLGRDTDVGWPELNLYEVNRDTAALTRVGTGTGIGNIRGTSGVTFDTIHREVILFDNNLNEIIAYSLDGQARKIFQFPGSAAFYNLAFDGHRLLTFHTDEQGVTRLYEIDREQRVLKPIQTLQSSLAVDAADILGVNQALKVNIATDTAAIQGANFLTNRMELPVAALTVANKGLTLTGPNGLEIRFSTESSTVPINFCVSTQASELIIQEESTGTDSITVKMSDFDDRVVLQSLPAFALQMGAGRDTLAFTGPVQFDLASLTGKVSGVDEIDLSQDAAARIVVHSAALRSFNPDRSLTLRIAAEDQLQLNNRPWRVDGPRVSSTDDTDSRRHQLVVDDVLLELIDGRGWRNPLLAEDVNRDGLVSAIDALLIINELNIGQARKLESTKFNDTRLEYVDPSGDNYLSSLDALLIVNQLNSRSSI